MTHIQHYNKICSDRRDVGVILSGKVLKDYPRDRAVITLKWGPEMTRDGQFLPLDLSPQNCRCAALLRTET